ncbi:MAG TPA: SDR family oxidoreductase [Acidimicrobiales bacterium]|nr:SDR family oxidoreductase [Acidimicrobiales bacterium]
MAGLGFDNKVAIVTGAGGGLGRSHALELARRGARVVVNDLGGTIDGSGHSNGPAAQVVREIETLGGEAVANTDSVASVEGGSAIVQSALDAFGRIDIVVNNAGILRDKAFHNMTPDLVDAVIDVHLKGAFNVTRAAWPHFRAQGYGRVVNTSSNSGILGNFGQANYGAAKMGLVGLTRVLAVEGVKHNIKANAIAPVAYTRMTADLMPGLETKLKPEFVTPVVIYLSHESCPVTGEVYSAGGGVVSRFFIGLTQGYVNTDLTAEDVRDHFDTVRDEHDYLVPAENSEELKKLFKQLS